MDINKGMNGTVKTPVGIGRIVARMVRRGEAPFSPIENSRYLVCLSRSDFDPAQWKQVSPGNGPCVFREFGAADLFVEHPK